MSKITGYKATDENGRCRDFQFIVGKTFETKEPISLCSTEFHFCLNQFDVYSYYPQKETTRVFEIEALGEVKTEGDKSVTNKIKIVRELETLELLKLWINRTNSGDGNSGNRNSGDGNSGDGNSGNRNSGNRNSGNRNSGNRNSGNRNSGDWNSGDGNSGYFNTTTPVYFFNKPSKLKYTQDLEDKLRSLNVKPILTYITSESMTDKEKADHPYHATTGGFLRSTGRHDWTKLTDQDKELILSLPNYDDEIFQKISNGVSLLKAKTVKISHDGQEYEIDVEKAKELGIIKK